MVSVEAGGVEFKSKSDNAPVFIKLQAADLFSIADKLTLWLAPGICYPGSSLQDFGPQLRGEFPPFIAAPATGASPEAAVAFDPTGSEMSSFFSKTEVSKCQQKRIGLRQQRRAERSQLCADDISKVLLLSVKAFGSVSCGFRAKPISIPE